MATVKLLPSGNCFSCEGRQSILDAALEASLALGYGCSSGSCGLCIGRLREGEIEKVRHHDFSVKDADRLRGYFLLCSYTAASPELLIEAEADSPAVLLRDYLGELLLRFERDGRVVTSVRTLEFGDESLKADVHTERLDKARSRLHREVKAVTYHELDLRETEEGFEATIIVDI